MKKTEILVIDLDLNENIIYASKNDVIVAVGISLPTINRAIKTGERVLIKGRLLCFDELLTKENC